METERKKFELKHLGFMRMAAIQTLACVSNLYGYAKQNSGPLRSTVGTVEGAVTSVVKPVYERFKDVPDDLLVFLDQKVNEISSQFDKHAPPLAKQVVSKAQDLLEGASQKAQKLVSEAQNGGPRAAAYYAASESKHLLLTNSVKVWVKLNHFPLFHTVSEMAVPTAAHWSEKYNHVVVEMNQKGYTIFGYLPLVPVDEIAKAFKQSEGGEKEEKINENGSSSDSD